MNSKKEVEDLTKHNQISLINVHKPYDSFRISNKVNEKEQNKSSNYLNPIPHSSNKNLKEDYFTILNKPKSLINEPVHTVNKTKSVVKETKATISRYKEESH